jgi:CHAT domain-containing protein
MELRFCLWALGILLFGGCNSGPSTPDGAVLLDEEVALEREQQVDTASREIAIEGESVIVAFVDEQLTDVKLKLAATDSSGKALALEVENNLGGAGIEIAVFEAPRDTRLTVTITGQQDANQPGRVRLRVRRFDAGSRESNYTAQVAAFRAWSAATTASLRADAIKKSALGDLDRAIASLEAASGDAALAAEARLIKANMLLFFRVDRRASRAEAQHAAKAFGALTKPDALNVARANYLEALALWDMAGDGAAVNPTSEEATQLARAILADLSAPTSVFGPIERARAISAQGDIDVETGDTDDSRKHYEEALAIYRAAGFSAGEREVKCNLAVVLLNRGQFRDSALAFDALLPELDRLSNPDRRALMYISAARGQAFSGRADTAPELLLKALALAREYKLRIREAGALLGLGNVYFNRGDPLQAREFFNEVLKISREENDAVMINAGLQLAGNIARTEGDYARAIELHKEGVHLASSPVARMRTIRELGMDYFYSGDYPAAIAELRRALAVKMQDPRHHAYSDVKRNLAEVLIDHGDGTSATLKEAGTLVGESLARSIEVGDKLGVIGGHRVTGELLAARGKRAEAQAEFERAFALAHEYREKSVSVQARAATHTHEQAAFRDYLDLMLSDVAMRGTAGPRSVTKREERALRMLETARDGNYGVARTGELDAAAAARMDGLLEQMAEQSLKIAAMLKRQLKGTEPAELEALQLGMSSLYAELDQERTKAALKMATTENFQPNTTRAWRKLGSGVVQLSYALGNEHAYAWARSDSGILVSVLAKSPKDLERELIELSALDRQAAPEKVEQALQRVSAVLLPEGLLPQDSSAVEIVAEGRIASVPFPGLRSPTAAGRRLVETHAITMVSSMFSVEEPPRPKQARPFRLVALASGHGTLRSAPVLNPAPKLQAATKEIRTVADLFIARDAAARIKLLLGSEGSAAALHDLWGSGADVVHFATHALADLRQPVASLLVLPATDAHGAPTYLTAGQVEGWRGDTGLVFLSACESAIGPPRFAGGMPGLQRAFLRAGARGVIATLWPIEDVLAQQFSADFYTRFTSGKTAVQALSETQRAWLAPDPGLSDEAQIRRRITALAHGFYAP